MTLAPTSYRLRALALSAILCAGLVAGGCGGSDDDSASTDVAGQTDGGAASGTTDTGANSNGSRDDGPAPLLLGERREARAGADAVSGVYDGLAAAASAGVASVDVPVTDTLEASDDNAGLTRFCDFMSEEAQRQTVVYAKRSAGLTGVKWNCERAMGLLLRRSKRQGELQRSVDATVVGVNAKGDRATATVRFGKSKQLSTLSLVKENGTWKLAATPTGDG